MSKVFVLPGIPLHASLQLQKVAALIPKLPKLPARTMPKVDIPKTGLTGFGDIPAHVPAKPITGSLSSSAGQGLGFGKGLPTPPKSLLSQYRKPIAAGLGVGAGLGGAMLDDYMSKQDPRLAVRQSRWGTLRRDALAKVDRNADAALKGVGVSGGIGRFGIADGVDDAMDQWNKLTGFQNVTEGSQTGPWNERQIAKGLYERGPMPREAVPDDPTMAPGSQWINPKRPFTPGKGLFEDDVIERGPVPRLIPDFEKQNADIAAVSKSFYARMQKVAGFDFMKGMAKGAPKMETMFGKTVGKLDDPLGGASKGLGGAADDLFKGAPHAPLPTPTSLPQAPNPVTGVGQGLPKPAPSTPNPTAPQPSPAPPPKFTRQPLGPEPTPPGAPYELLPQTKYGPAPVDLTPATKLTNPNLLQRGYQRATDFAKGLPQNVGNFWNNRLSRTGRNVAIGSGIFGTASLGHNAIMGGPPNLSRVPSDKSTVQLTDPAGNLVDVPLQAGNQAGYARAQAEVERLQNEFYAENGDYAKALQNGDTDLAKRLLDTFEASDSNYGGSSWFGRRMPFTNKTYGVGHYRDQAAEYAKKMQEHYNMARDLPKATTEPLAQEIKALEAKIADPAMSHAERVAANTRLKLLKSTVKSREGSVPVTDPNAIADTIAKTTFMDPRIKPGTTPPKNPAVIQQSKPLSPLDAAAANPNTPQSDVMARLAVLQQQLQELQNAQKSQGQ